MEAAQRLLEAKERCPVGSEWWAEAAAFGFGMLTSEVCAEVAKPEWWNDEGLKALSARVMRAAPDSAKANVMRAGVLRGSTVAWEAGPRSATELKKCVEHFDRAAALCPVPAVKAELAGHADVCRTKLFAAFLPEFEAMAASRHSGGFTQPR